MPRSFPELSSLSHFPELFSVHTLVTGTLLQLEFCDEVLCFEKDGSQDKDRGDAIQQLWGEQLSFILNQFPAILCAFLEGEDAEDWSPWVSSHETIDGPLGIVLIGYFSGDTFSIFRKKQAGIPALPFIGVFSKGIELSVPYFSRGALLQDLATHRLYIKASTDKISREIKTAIRQMPSREEVKQFLVKSGCSPVQVSKILADEFTRTSFRDTSSQK